MKGCRNIGEAIPHGHYPHSVRKSSRRVTAISADGINLPPGGLWHPPEHRGTASQHCLDRAAQRFLAALLKRLPPVFSLRPFPHSPIAEFFSVKEAARRIGRSPSSIRRVIHPIVKAENHPDRGHVLPTPEDSLKLRMQGENFAWQISEELLAKAFPPEERQKAASATESAGHAEEGRELLFILRQELAVKNQQITQQGEMIGRQMELINGLSERLREGNILIGSLQKQVAMIGEGSSRRREESLEAVTKEPPKKTGSPPPKKASKPEKPKRGLLRRLFFS